MSTLPPTTNPPWTPEAISKALSGARGTNPTELIEYMRQIVVYLDRTYADVADAVNQLHAQIKELRDEFDTHTHP
jgi:hypothetical protein